MSKRRNAYSLAELILIILFLAILAVISLPRFSGSAISKRKAGTTARKIVTDLRRTRSLAISNAANNSEGFGLNMLGQGTYTAYEIVNLKTSSTIPNGVFSIDSAIDCTGGDKFEFGPLGSLKTGSDSRLTVGAQGRSFKITIIPATGAVQCTKL